MLFMLVLFYFSDCFGGVVNIENRCIVLVLYLLIIVCGFMLLFLDLDIFLVLLIFIGRLLVISVVLVMWLCLLCCMFMLVGLIQFLFFGFFVFQWQYDLVIIMFWYSRFCVGLLLFIMCVLCSSLWKKWKYIRCRIVCLMLLMYWFIGSQQLLCLFIVLWVFGEV